MIPEDFLLNLIEFSEHPITDISQKQATTFDICLIPEVDTSPNFIKNGQFDHKSYCECLLMLMLKIPEDNIEDFIDYQLKLVLNPIQWLKCFERLILRNRSVLKSDFLSTVIINKINSFYFIYNHSKQVIKRERFCFKSVKEELGKIDSYIEKLRLIKIKKTEYLQEKADHPNRYKHKYFIQLKYEEQLLVDLLKHGTLFNESLQRPHEDQKTVEPLQLNCNINQLVDVFYQMKYEMNVDGKPLFEGSLDQISYYVSKMFVDKEGHPLSPSSIKTFLQPSRFEKRPRNQNRLIVEKKS